MKRRALMAAALLGAPVVLSGCGVTRDGTLSPSVNDCVAALPVAQTLVGSKAHLEVLRRYALPDTQRVLARLGAPLLTPADATPAERAPIAAAGIPTDFPTAFPTGVPTDLPTDLPTQLPTDLPTALPTNYPTAAAAHAPTSRPTDLPRVRRTPRPGESAARALGVRPCLIVFTGDFTTTALKAAPGHPAITAVAGVASGGYVLVITTTRHPRVLRAVVATKDPLD